MWNYHNKQFVTMSDCHDIRLLLCLVSKKCYSQFERPKQNYAWPWLKRWKSSEMWARMPISIPGKTNFAPISESIKIDPSVYVRDMHPLTIWPVSTHGRARALVKSMLDCWFEGSGPASAQSIRGGQGNFVECEKLWPAMGLYRVTAKGLTQDME